MAKRGRIGSTSNSKQNFKEIDRVANSFKAIEAPSAQLTIFGNKSTALTPTQTKYNQAVYKIRRYLLQPLSVVPDFTTRELYCFYLHQFEHVYKCPPIDYNYFNVMKTFNFLQDALQLNDFELAVELAFWFVRYENVTKDLNIERQMTLSALKKLWVVEMLVHNDTKKGNFY